MRPRQVDLLLATLVVAAAGLEAALADATPSARLAAAMPAGLAAGALLLRRREPLVAQAVAIAAVASTILLADAVRDALSSVFVVLLYVTYFMAAHESGRRLQAGVALAVGGAAVMTAAPIDYQDEGSTAAVLGSALAFFVIAPVVAGRLLHSRLRLSSALVEKAQAAEADHAERAAEAAAAERGRIAGELHDIVSHSLGAMTVQAAAARRLATRDATLAAGAFEAIEIAGRGALAELRTLLEALREDSEADPLHASQPTLARLDTLAERARAAGLPVTVEVSGSPPEALPAGLDFTAYRVVQEALRAALHEGHAAQATVRVRYLGDCLELEVVDDGGRIADRGLMGLRERVRLFGGSVDAEAGGDCHCLCARLPLERVPA